MVVKLGEGSSNASAEGGFSLVLVESRLFLSMSAEELVGWEEVWLFGGGGGNIALEIVTTGLLRGRRTALLVTLILQISAATPEEESELLLLGQESLEALFIAGPSSCKAGNTDPVAAGKAPSDGGKLIVLLAVVVGIGLDKTVVTMDALVGGG